MTTSERRGGKRQRRYAKKDGLGDIDRISISNLLRALAPTVDVDRREFALALVVTGIEDFRKSARNGPKLTRPAQESRRALERFKKGKVKGKRGTVDAPLNAVVEFDGRLFGTSDTGLYEIEDDPSSNLNNGHEGLDEAIVGPLRAWSVLQQRAVGIKNPNPNLAFNPQSGTGEDGDPSTLADLFLDNLIKPGESDTRLAGAVYLALVLGLSIKVSMACKAGTEIKRVGRGWNYERLLNLAAEQAGIELPSSRAGKEGLMKRGKAYAEAEVKEMMADGVVFEPA